jgi:hypothetical protein
MKALDLAIRIATLIALAAIALALTRLEEHFRGSVEVSGRVSQ